MDEELTMDPLLDAFLAPLAEAGISLDSKSNPSALTSATAAGDGHALVGRGQCAAERGHSPEHRNAASPFGAEEWNGKKDFWTILALFFPQN